MSAKTLLLSRLPTQPRQLRVLKYSTLQSEYPGKSNSFESFLEDDKTTKWGFVVYRCTYGDDAAWARFMEILNKHLEKDLSKANPELLKRYDWNVQEDPSLEGVSKTEIRRRHRRWVSSRPSVEKCPDPIDHSDEIWERQSHDNPRHNYCIHVDAASLRSVLHKKSSDPSIVSDGNEEYVNLVRTDSSWDDFDPATYDDSMDENNEECEGSKLWDVGWTRIPPEHILGAYRNLMAADWMWDKMYVRPTDGISYNFYDR